MPHSITAYTPISCYSNGDRYWEEPPGLFEDRVPEALRKREEDCPQVQWINDRMRYPGDRPTIIATKGNLITIVSELESNRMGVLFGVRRHGRTRWKEYKHLEDTTFEDASKTLREWVAKTGELALEGAEEAA